MIHYKSNSCESLIPVMSDSCESLILVKAYFIFFDINILKKKVN